MAMRKEQRNELRKLREITRSLLEGKRCVFCKKLLITGRVIIGGADGSPVKGITIHHANGNHFDDHKSNRRYVHTSCHKSFHMRQGWQNGQFKKESLK